jgi:hypothetical protein
MPASIFSPFTAYIVTFFLSYLGLAVLIAHLCHAVDFNTREGPCS